MDGRISEPEGGSKVEVTVATPRPICRRERGRMVGKEAEEAAGDRLVSVLWF